MFSDTGKRYALGLLSMIVCVVGWVASRFLIQKINLVYPKPFLLSYLANATRILYFPILLIWGDPLAKPENEDASGEVQEGGKIRESLRVAGWMTPLQGLLTLCNQLTFSTLSLSTGSILFNSNPVFLMGIGWMLGWERVTVMRVAAALTAASSLILLGSREIAHSPDDLGWKGVLAALGSALSFALISLLLKRQVMDLKQASMLAVYGWVGLIILLGAWPLLLIAHWAGWERLQFPPLTAIPLIIGNSLLGTFIFNLAWLIAFAWTSELVVAIGMGLSLPLTFVVDLVLNGERIGWIKWLTLVISVSAFALVNIATRRPDWDYPRS